MFQIEEFLKDRPTVPKVPHSNKCSRKKNAAIRIMLVSLHLVFEREKWKSSGGSVHSCNESGSHHVYSIPDGWRRFDTAVEPPV